jgi:hypothetical protein
MISPEERRKHEMLSADKIRAGLKANWERAKTEVPQTARVEAGRAVSEARDQVVMDGWFGRGHQSGAAPSHASLYGQAPTTGTAGAASVYGTGPSPGGGIHGPAAGADMSSVYGTAPAQGAGIHGGETGGGASSVYGTPQQATSGGIHGPAAGADTSAVYGTAPAQGGGIHGSATAKPVEATTVAPPAPTPAPPEKKGPEPGLGR